MVSSLTSSSVSKYVPRNLLSVLQIGDAPKRCVGPTGYSFNSAYRVTNAMSPDMTPEEFDLLTADNPEYRLTDGGRCGWTAMQVALSKNYPVSLITHMLDRDPTLVDSGMSDCVYVTPLMMSVNSLALVKLLVGRGADINLSNCKSNTPLLSAAKRGSDAVMKYLLLHGGVVYTGYFEQMIKPFWSTSEMQEGTNKALANLMQAIEELWGLQCFKNGTLHSEKSDSLVTLLPYELRLKIGSFVLE